MNANLKRVRVPSVVHSHGGSLLSHEHAVLRVGGSEEALRRRVANGRIGCYRLGAEVRYDFSPPPSPPGLHVPDHLEVRSTALDAALERCAAVAGRPFDPSWPLVYLIQAGEDGPFKIGRTSSLRSLRSRLHSMQTGSHDLLIVRRLVRGTAVLERRLHKRFREHGIRGEWFRPVPELVAYSQADAA